MFPKTRQQAWISGLPGLDRKGGIPFETLPISAPKSVDRSLNFTLFGSRELISSLQSFAKEGTRLPTLIIVVRTNAEKELDDQYLMTGAVISSVSPMKEIPEAQEVNTLFDSVSARMGVNLNPGPPANAPKVQPAGVNMGWIFGLPDEDAKSGRPIEIVDFTPPHFNRRLTITLGNINAGFDPCVLNQRISPPTDRRASPSIRPSSLFYRAGRWSQPRSVH